MGHTPRFGAWYLMSDGIWRDGYGNFFDALTRLVPTGFSRERVLHDWAMESYRGMGIYWRGVHVLLFSRTLYYTIDMMGLGRRARGIESFWWLTR
jgi:hypothetical protein